MSASFRGGWSAPAATPPNRPVATLVEDRDEDAVRLLSRAFHDDPLFRHGWPDAADRGRAAQWVFRWNLRHGRQFGLVLATGGRLEGLAIVYPVGCDAFAPEKLALSGYDEIGEQAGAAGWVRLNAPFLEADAVLHHVVPEPHWYLDCIAVEPSCQGAGVGSALLREINGRADAAGLPLVLMTMQARNTPFYERHGFVQVCGGQVGNAQLEWWGFRRPV